MSDSAPDLHMLNVVVADTAASLDSYRRLGVAGPGSGDAAGAHVQVRMPSGFSLELDTAEPARLWQAGWRAGPASVGVVIGFSLPAREAVDGRYVELASAGYRGRQPPFGAFWGARYAVVADPDGNDVGLMSDRRITPHVAAAGVAGSLRPARGERDQPAAGNGRVHGAAPGGGGAGRAGGVWLRRL